jgi:hypothetical protein
LGSQVENDENVRVATVGGASKSSKPSRQGYPQKHNTAVLKNIKRQVAETEDDVSFLRRANEAANASLTAVRNEQGVLKDNVLHLQNEISNNSQKIVSQELSFGNLKRSFVGFEDQMRQMHISIQERATRGELTARIKASVDPLRTQIEMALKAQSQAVANATATAMAAAHKAQASAELVEARSSTLEASATMNGSAANANGSMMQSEANHHHLEVVEVRIERRLERVIEDKIELAVARFKAELRDEMVQGASSQGTAAGRGSGEGETGSIAVIDRINDVYERVLGLGGKLAEEVQRRHLAVSGARAEARSAREMAEKAGEVGNLSAKIEMAVSKAMSKERQDLRREKAMEAQRASAELERVRSSLQLEIEKRDKTIFELSQRVERAQKMAARAAKPPGPPPGQGTGAVKPGAAAASSHGKKTSQASTEPGNATPAKPSTAANKRVATPATSTSTSAPPSSTAGKANAKTKSTAVTGNLGGRPPPIPSSGQPRLTSKQSIINMRSQQKKKAEEEARRAEVQRASRVAQGSAGGAAGKRKAATKPVNAEVEKVRKRLKEMEAKATSISSSLMGKKDPSKKGPAEDKTVNPSKPPPKKQCPYCLRKFPGPALAEHKANCSCRIVACVHCGKGRMARQIATHEKFCDKRPQPEASSTEATAAKSKKSKCQHCDQMVGENHKCEWEPRKCQYCRMQIIARDINKHEQNCSAKAGGAGQTGPSSAGAKVADKPAPESKKVPVPTPVPTASSTTRSNTRSFQNCPPRQWSTTQVVQWLSSVGVNKLVQKKFTYHDVDGALLLEVEEGDLKTDLGVNRKHDRNRLIAAIKHLKAKHGYDDDEEGMTSTSSSSSSSSDDDGDGDGTDDSFDRD